MVTSSILATLDLTDDTQRMLVEVIRRMHSGKRSLFRRMVDLQRSGDGLIELAEWRSGGFAVVRWSLTSIAMEWRDYATLSAARTAFVSHQQI